MVKEKLGTRLAINWKYFSLEQVNSQQAPEWKIWEQPADYTGRGLRAFWAAEAVRHQGEAIFNSFHVSLLKARHEQHQDIADTGTLLEVAESTGVAMARFKKDLSDRQLLAKLAKDHTFAVETLGIFGTPTMVFPENRAVFLKMSAPPPRRECLSVFTELRHFARRRGYIQEIKRPQRPIG